MRGTLICLFLPAILAGCEDGPKRTYDAGAGRGDVPSATSALVDPAAAVPSHPVFEPTKPRVKLPCRAIGVGGTVKIFPSLDAMGGAMGAVDAGAPLALMDTLPMGSFVELGEGAKVTVKSPLTSRETALKGPGRGMFCVDNEEKSWLLEGTFESSMGAGEAPGSEEWIFSPLGVVRYGSSNLSMQATRRRLEVHVIAGTASLFTPEDAWRRADAGFSAVLAPKDEKTDDRRAAEATTACTAQAALTHKIALSVANPDSGLAAANSHVLARRDARALCGMAALLVAGLPASKRADLVEKVTKASEDWQKID